MSCGRWSGGGFGFGGRLGFCGDFGALSGQRRVDGGGFRGMNLVVVLVRFGEVVLVPQQAAEAVGRAQLVVDIHLDGVERADLDADLAAHADGNIDIEDLGIELRLADGVGLFIGAFLNENALRRAFFFADLAGDAAQALLPVLAVVDEEGKIRDRPQSAATALRDIERWSVVLC